MVQIFGFRCREGKSQRYSSKVHLIRIKTDLFSSVMSDRRPAALRPAAELFSS